MFRKTIRFQNFDGDTVEREFYFHMSKAELLEMAADGNSMMERIKRIIATNDGKAILQEYRAIIKASVGMRSEDGQRFIKDEEAQSYLLDSPAYDELLMELCTDADASANFVNQLIPEKMQKEMQEALAKQKGSSTPDPLAEPTDTRPLYQREHRHPSPKELAEMTKEELQEAFRWRAENNK